MVGAFIAQLIANFDRRRHRRASITIADQQRKCSLTHVIWKIFQNCAQKNVRVAKS